MVLHTTKLIHTPTLIVKVDMSKEYGRVNLIYLIISCVTLVYFVVLINGSTSPFFKLGRGIRSGSPMDPLLFILVVEGLSIIIFNVKHRGTLKGVVVRGYLCVTHMFFVDDILLFSNGSRRGVIVVGFT